MVLEVNGFRCLKKIKCNMFIGWKGCLGALLLLAGLSVAYADVNTTIVNETRCMVSSDGYPRIIKSNSKSQSVPIYYYQGKLDDNPRDLTLAGTVVPNSRYENVPFVDSTWSKRGGKDTKAIVISLMPPPDGGHPDSFTGLSILQPRPGLPSGYYVYYFGQGIHKAHPNPVAYEIENQDQIHQCSPDQP